MLSPSNKFMAAIGFVWNQVMEMFVAALLAVLVVVVLAGVVSRYFVNSPLPWTEELARYLFIWISFVGAGVGVKSGANFGLNLVANHLPPRAHAVVEIGVNLVVAVFGAALAYYGWMIMPIVGFQKASSMPFSISYVFLAIVIGGVLMLVNGLVRVLEAARSVSRPVQEGTVGTVPAGPDTAGQSEGRP